MTFSLAIAFLFFLGAMLGWLLEFFYRNLISGNGPKGTFFINPGFCKGPYLPIYGIGLSVMFVISYYVSNYLEEPPAIVIILIITLCMTLIELIGGVFLLKVLNMRLWDYRDQPGNFMGVICPLFSLIWGSIGAVYYLFIHPAAIDSIMWLADNLAFSFFVGLFFGFFIIDLYSSANEAMIIKEFGDKNDVIVKYEELKRLVQSKRLETAQKVKFFNQTITEEPILFNFLGDINAIAENKKLALKSKRNKKKEKK